MNWVVLVVHQYLVEASKKKRKTSKSNIVSFLFYNDEEHKEEKKYSVCAGNQGRAVKGAAVVVGVGKRCLQN